jgi:hypothetical protein
MAPPSSGLKNSKKGENRYLAQEGKGHDGDRENHFVCVHRGYRLVLPLW